MTDVRLSSSTRALLRAAKGDAPTAAARAKVWAGVSSAVGGAAGGAGAAGSSGGAGAGGASTATSGATAGLGVAKMLAVGALLGGTVTVGLAVALLRIVPVPAEAPTVAAAPIAAMATSTSKPTPTATPTPTSKPTPTSTRHAEMGTVNPFPAHSVARPSPAPASAPSDPLAREAALVDGARAALARHDPSSALRDVRDARALSSHQLTPEELAVEAQALRALGRDDEADRDDALLRTKYPESALAP